MIVDAGLETFAEEVVEASMKVPVLVDFWAPWCGPCKQLTPVLEKLVSEQKGRIKLVKINVDENPELSQQLRVQSIPTVYAFVQGQPATAFSGAQPESQLKQLITQLMQMLPAEAVDDVMTLDDCREALDNNELERALAGFGTLYEENPEEADYAGGFARTLMALGEMEQARAIVEALPADKKSHKDVAQVLAMLSIADEAGALRDHETLESLHESQPDDHDIMLELSTSCFLRGQIDKAVSLLIASFKKDRDYQDGAAKKKLLGYFEALGPMHPESVKGRRQLSAVLFS